MFTWGSHDGTLSSSVDKSLDGDGLGAPANGLGGFTLSPDSASVDTFSESTDNSSSFHSSEPLASSPSALSSLVGDTSLSLSVPSSDDLSTDSSSGTSHPSLSTLCPDGTSLSVSEESSDDSSFD